MISAHKRTISTQQPYKISCICGRNDFPHSRQHDSTDCGPTSLKNIAEFYGKHYSLDTLREYCHITREGVSLLGISDAAESIGFRTTGVKLDWEQFKEEANLPCIVHWNQAHFVVVYRMRKRKGKWYVSVSDPANGLMEYEESDFLKFWSPEYRQSGTDMEKSQGIALFLEPTPSFYRKTDNQENRLTFGCLLAYLIPYKGYIIQLALAMLTAALLGLCLPFLTQSIVDVGIVGGDLTFIVVILAAQMMLVIGQMANKLIRSWLMLHMTTRVSISLISDFLAKLMRLPIAFFDSRMVGDIMQRIGDHNRIQSFLTGSLLSMVMAFVSLIIYGVVMGGYSLTILAVFIIGSILYVVWVLIFLKKRRKLDYMRFQESANNQSNVVQLISGMQEIKLNNCEKQKRWQWEHIQARLFKVSIKGLELGQVQEIGATFIDQLKSVLMSFIAARTVIKGDMSLGMMMALQYVIGQLNAPISKFISFVQATQDARLSMERLSEIHEKVDEEPVGSAATHEIPRNVGIEFKNVTFQYEGPHSEKALDDVSISIPSGKVTAIVGASGSGKTTLLKIILGFYTPTTGQVMLGSKPLSQYSVLAWRKCCGTVMQEGYIFDDTIANNIAVSDSVVDMERVRRAAKTANIAQFVDELPLGYDTKIGASGHGISIGQKQRLLIARAAYRNAVYLLFDEATNSLDANNEKTIMENLEQLFDGKTVVIVAHRLSTVKNADVIIVLDHGKVVEQGTHTQLTEKKGYYYELVRNQLELGS